MTENSNAPYFLREHCHDGIWYPNIVLDSSIESMRTFEVRSDDVWIVTYPKAGTHWMLEIVGLILNDGFPEKFDRSLNSSTVEMINLGSQKFPKSREEEEKNPVDMTPFMNVVEKAPSPRVIITHLRLDRLPQDMVKKAKVIYVARNPKDVATSWFNFVGKIPTYPQTWEEILQSFLDGKMHWGPWPEHVTEFWKIRDAENLLFLSYEHLLRDPSKHIQEIANHIGVPLSAEALHRVVEKSSMSQMKKTFQKLAEGGQEHLAKGAGQFVFLQKGKSGQWKNRFTVAQSEMFDKWYQDKTAGSDLDIPFE